jgi:hypothetical protein
VLATGIEDCGTFGGQSARTGGRSGFSDVHRGR